jgi:hypothetical protein
MVNIGNAAFHPARSYWPDERQPFEISKSHSRAVRHPHPFETARPGLSPALFNLHGGCKLQSVSICNGKNAMIYYVTDNSYRTDTAFRAGVGRYVNSEPIWVTKSRSAREGASALA